MDMQQHGRIARTVTLLCAAVGTLAVFIGFFFPEQLNIIGMDKMLLRVSYTALFLFTLWFGFIGSHIEVAAAVHPKNIAAFIGE